MRRTSALCRFLVTLGFALAASSCDSGALPTEESVNRDLYGNFETAVVSNRNYDVYWLGRSFVAGGLAYKGPEADAPTGGGVGAGVGGVEGGGLEMYYGSKDGCACSSLTLTIYSRPAWDRFPARTAPPPGVRSKPVQVNGHPAELWTGFDPPAKIGSQILLVDYGNTVVRATTSSIIPRTPGPEPNPLIDETTFLAVMQNLRAYPD